ncbi:hypothetical protein [Morganella sp. EGD-HP17]|uniref:hypothetical protein n=1 Tax=Morganella sp. EGD-HP17 TaxID=1435146 RepID=UPI0004289150|nr:hypothetical protein [Morganella sp. EGD-HP17]
MQLEFKRLTQIKPADITALNNHPKVLQQMPLGSPDFDDGKSRNWAEEKDAQWEINGYGPWAFVIDDVFAGWGGKVMMLTWRWYFILISGEREKSSVMKLSATHLMKYT